MEDHSENKDEVQSDIKSPRSVWRLILVAVLVVVLSAGGLAAWRSVGRSTYVEGLSAYSQMDVDTAVQKFDQVSRSPEFFGGYVLDAREKLKEVEAFQQARQNREDGEYAESLEQFSAFIETYETSPYLGECRAAVGEIPFEWAQQAIEEDDYQAAHEIFEDVINGSYPGVVKTEARNNLPAILLEWGGYLVEQEELSQAVEVYREAYGSTIDSQELERAEENVRAIYQNLEEDAHAAENFEESVQNYQALASWLEEKNLPGAADAQQQAVQVSQQWGDHLYQQEDYASAVQQYQHTLESAEGEYQASTHQNLAAAYMAWGDSLLSAANSEDAVEKYIYLIENYHDQPDYTNFSEQASAALLAYAQESMAEGAYEHANQIFSVLARNEISAELEVDLYLNWGVSLLAAGTHHSYLQSLRKLAAALELAQAAGDQQRIEEIESVQSDAALTISRLDSGLGQLILDAAEADRYDTKKFPVCREVEGEDLCLDEEGFLLVSPTFGLDQDVDLFVFMTELPDYLIAASPGQAEFYIVIDQSSTKIDSCTYYPDSPMRFNQYYLERHRRVTTATIYRLQSGDGVAQTSFKGGDPPTCPSSRPFGKQTEYEYGPYPDYGQIFNWLRNYARLESTQ